MCLCMLWIYLFFPFFKRNCFTTDTLYHEQLEVPTSGKLEWNKINDRHY